MRLLSLDFDPVYGEENVRATFSGDVSAFDFDVVMWEPAVSLDTYTERRIDYYKNLPALSDNDSVRIRADVQRRCVEFEEFLNTGRTVVVIVRPPQEVYVATGTKDFSGTGRNRVATRHVALFDLLSALPSRQPEFNLASGSRINIDGDGPIAGVLRKYKNHLVYVAVMKGAVGTPLARVAGTDRIVSAVQRFPGGGNLILLPALAFGAEVSSDSDQDEEDEDPWLEEAVTFQQDLLEAINQLSGTKVVSRPAWAQRFATEQQQRLRSEVVKQQARIEAARSKLARLQQQQEEAETRDQLFLGTGRTLELEVRHVLEVLGGVVVEPEPGRDDWRVTFPEGDAVVEVKGVNKTAAEKHAAQLEKWVSAAFEETGKMPKGILVVNTWRETPLDERTGADFPPQMLPYSQSRGHCLVTGLQMFVIRADVERDRKRAAYWRKALLGNIGPIKGCEDWRALIREIRSSD